MKKNKLKVSIGLSAYNEEKNIESVLRNIFNQNTVNWYLEEILIYSDGSTDKTIEKAKQFSNRKIKLKDFKDRRGKVYRVSQLCHDFTGDVLIIFDSDIQFNDNNVIENLIVPFLSEKKVMLVGGNSRPLEPRTFFERAVYSTFMVLDASRKELKGGHNMFGCTGSCIGIKNEFAKKLKFQPVLNEDDFMYFSCLSQGFKFRHVRNAIVYYKLPTRLKDYLRQIFRSNPEAVSVNFKKYFGNLIEKEYERKPDFYLKQVFKSFLRYPLETLYIIMIHIIAKPLFPFISKNYKLNWYTAVSTKILLFFNLIEELHPFEDISSVWKAIQF